MSNNPPISERWRLAAEEWLDADAAARLREETKSAYFAQRCAELGDIPVSKAELKVRASSDWLEFVKGMVDAKTRANKAKIQMEYINMLGWEARSREATYRAEAKL